MITCQKSKKYTLKQKSPQSLAILINILHSKHKQLVHTFSNKNNTSSQFITNKGCLDIHRSDLNLDICSAFSQIRMAINNSAVRRNLIGNDSPKQCTGNDIHKVCQTIEGLLQLFSNPKCAQSMYERFHFFFVKHIFQNQICN